MDAWGVNVPPQLLVFSFSSVCVFTAPCITFTLQTFRTADNLFCPRLCGAYGQRNVNAQITLFYNNTKNSLTMLHSILLNSTWSCNYNRILHTCQAEHA